MSAFDEDTVRLGGPKPMTTEPKDTREEVATLRSSLIVATGGACTCDTKTPELQFHEQGCHYRLFSEADAMLRRLITRAEEAEKTIDKALCDEWFPHPAGPERFGARIMELQHLEKVEALETQLAEANERAERAENEASDLQSAATFYRSIIKEAARKAKITPTETDQ